ncbi:cellulose biosynthesis cyclic di-GMP-binding regulatory protein BcsB [Synechococcus sp. OH2]|uniref:cellulose biosynthesis cyclic di-GMP-binding regulatory protein BcsB n=1 Tax=Synechococcus sp. OH2 TaxID=136798 RepID=UPI0039C0CDA7
MARVRQRRGGWGLLVAGLLCCVPTEAVRAEPLAFQRLGYERSVLLQGSNPRLDVTVPAPINGIDPEASFVQLRLEPSPVLKPTSTVRVLINEELAGIFLVQDLRQEPVVRVPIPDLPPGERFITVSVQPFLSISDDICADLNTGNLLLRVGRDSFFELVPRVPDATVAGFLRLMYPQLTLVVPANPSPEVAEAALGLYSLLAHLFPQTPILWSNRPGEGPQVILEPANFTPHLQHQVTPEGSRLRVAARREAILALYEEWKRAGLVSRGIRVAAVADWERALKANRLSLRELGIVDPLLRGFGSQSLVFNFNLAQLGGRPRDLAAQLDVIMNPVDGRAGDRLTGYVFFNGVLLRTYNLTGRSQLNETVTLPTRLLRRFNQLELRFDYGASPGNCQGSLTPLTVQVRSDSSGFLWSGYQAPSGELQEIPAVLQGSGRVWLGDPQWLPAAAYLVGALSRLAAQPLLPTLQFLPQEKTKLETGDFAWQILVAAPEQVELPYSPIRLGSQFEILNPLNQQVALAAQPQENLGLLQYFLLQGRPTLWLSWWGSDPVLAERLSRGLADPRTRLANQLQGNVLTAYAAAPALTQVQSWDLTPQGYRVRYPGRFSWQLLLWQYRYWLVLLLAILLAVGAWNVYGRLARRPESPIPS